MPGKMSAAKAKKILKDGEVGGKPLTPDQKKLFGLIAAGKVPSRLNDITKSRRKKAAA